MTRALVIGRARKGRPIADAVAETSRQLEAAGWSITPRVVDRKRQVRRETKRAVGASVDVVVGVGGDGAVLQVIQKLAETKVALGIIPMGTGNLLATNLGIPTDLDAAVQVLLGQRLRVIDVGHVKAGATKSAATKSAGTKSGATKSAPAKSTKARRGVRGGKGGKSGKGVKPVPSRYFAVACGVGFDAEVMDATAKPRKRRLGKLAYIATAIGQRGKVRNVRHEISIDGVARSGTAMQVFVANFGKMGLPMEPQLEIQPDDGRFDVIILRAKGPVEGLAAGWAAIRQRRRGRSFGGRVVRAHAGEVGIATDQPRLVEIDGSVVGTTPIELSIRPAALTVIVPAD